MRKVFLLTVAFILAAGMVFAGARQQSSDQVTLRFSWWGTDARHEATLAVIDAFQKANPNIKIEPEYGAQSGYNEKKTTEFASRTAPDIFQIETGAGPEYYRMGVLQNLSRLSSIKFDKFDANFLKTNGQFGSGSQWTIPTGVAGTQLVVNKTLADQIGIDLTQQFDWEQLITWGQQVRAYNSEYYLLSANTSYAMPFFVRAYARQLNGAPIINDANMTLNMTEAQFRQCFEFVDRLYKTGTCAPAAYKAPFGDQDQNDPNWIAGKYVAHVGYTSSAEVVQAANPSAQYVPGRLPLMANRKSDGWYNDCPQYMGIYAETKYPEQAAKFLDFFFNSEEAARLLGTVRSVPPTAMGQKIVTDAGRLNKLTADGVAMSLTYNGQTDSGHTTAQEVKAILDSAYEAVSYGAKTPAVAAREVVEQLNAYLARNK
jgi:oligogalacturonide transport system substrate-binding protein